MPGTNAAQRVANHFKRLNSSTLNTPMSEALGVFFEYKPHDAIREHARKLELLQSQIDIAVDGLKRQGFPEHLYNTQVQSARNAFSASGLNQQWNHVVSQITPDVKLAFDWMAFALPDQCDAMEKAAMSDLLESLKAILTDDLLQTLPAVWKELIERHINAIFEALAEQPITGSGPVEKAVKDLATDVMVHSEELRDAPVSPEAKPLLKRVFGAVGKTVDLAVKSEKVLSSIDKLYKLAAENWPLLKEWVQRISN